MVDETLKRRKEQQRKIAVEARNALSARQLAEKSAIICETLKEHPVFLQAQVLFSYQAFRNEVDLSALHRYAAKTGKKVAYPISGKEGQMVAAVPEDDEAWITDRFGIKAPTKERSLIIPPEEIQLVLVPCAAFDGKQRMRIGWGAGFYDRYLPRCNNAVSIAVAYEVQKMEPLVFDPDWDVPLDAIVTEDNWYGK
jgi:5-formyltetrahydrofolate cyclo-ligase